MYNNFNNEDWNSQSYNNFDNQHQTYYKEIIVRPERSKKRKFLTYTSLVLITSLITSFVVGGAMYSSFSKKLDEQVTGLQKTVALSSSVSSNKSATEVTTGTESPTAKTLLNSAASNGADLSVTEIAKKVGPSIVGIKMTVKNGRQSGYFGMGSQSADSEGSGIIISKDGYIVTNYHVVEYADPKNSNYKATLTVYLPDKRETTATFIGGDSDNDLAVLKINMTDLPVAELGDSSDVEVGDLAVAIGNPLGMEFAGSVTSGVISALNRQLDTGDVSMSLIQTDAAINPGNSGGALLNSKGQVVGINSAKISVTGVEGLGFAIPINTAKPIIEQLVTYGYITGKPLIGISAQEVTADISSIYGIPEGVYIVEVTQGGAAEKAGIKKGDVLIKLDGKEIKTMADIDAVKKSHKAGDTVAAVVTRNGSNMTVNLTFTEAK